MLRPAAGDSHRCIPMAGEKYISFRYADTEVVRRHVAHTRLHKLVVVFHGVDMAVCEEVKATSEAVEQ